ncbi:MAG: hypothetical protein RL042_1727 [Nitrospirota bacterium]|jgi:hypothetical protein
MAACTPSIRLVVGTLCILLLSCAGCSVRRITVNDIITAEQTGFIRVGETTMREVVDRIGAPDDMAESESGAVALYNWSDVKSAALDFGAIARLLLPYAPTLTLNKTAVAPEEFQVVFDHQWTVRAYGFSRMTTERPIVWFWPF